MFTTAIVLHIKKTPNNQQQYMLCSIALIPRSLHYWNQHILCHIRNLNTYTYYKINNLMKPLYILDICICAQLHYTQQKQIGCFNHRAVTLVADSLVPRPHPDFRVYYFKILEFDWSV